MFFRRIIVLVKTMADIVMHKDIELSNMSAMTI